MKKTGFILIAAALVVVAIYVFSNPSKPPQDIPMEGRYLGRTAKDYGNAPCELVFTLDGMYELTTHHPTVGTSKQIGKYARKGNAVWIVSYGYPEVSASDPSRDSPTWLLEGTRLVYQQKGGLGDFEIAVTANSGMANQNSPVRPDGPTDGEVLEAYKRIGMETVGYQVETISGGGLTIPAGPSKEIGPLLDVASIKNIARSIDGIRCLVVANVDCNWLPAIFTSTAVQGGFQAWFETYGSSGSNIKPEWLGNQRQKRGITLKDAKIVFRRFDNGWRFEGMGR
jgi:hypothetical protein